MSLFELAPGAEDDVWDIWQYLALQAGSEIASRVESELFDAFTNLTQAPNIGHRRTDLTTRPVLFYTLYSYLIIYVPDTSPLQIIAVLHGKRNVKRILADRM